MRKDVKIGFGIGGVMLAVLIVYLLVVPGRDSKPPQVTLQDPPPAINVDPLPVVPPPTDSGVVKRPIDPPTGETTDASPLTTTPPESTPVASARTEDVDWKRLLDTGESVPLMTQTPAPTPRATVAPIEPPAQGDDGADMPLVLSNVSRFDSSPPPPTVRPSTGPRTHIVQRGETLSSIAQAAYGSANFWPHIARANPSIKPNALRPGASITLPEIADASASTSGDATPTDSSSEYRVKSGDSLYKISMKLYGRADRTTQLYESNKQLIGPDPEKLKPGMILKLPEAPPATAAR